MSNLWIRDTLEKVNDYLTTGTVTMEAVILEGKISDLFDVVTPVKNPVQYYIRSSEMKPRIVHDYLSVYASLGQSPASRLFSEPNYYLFQISPKSKLLEIGGGMFILDKGGILSMKKRILVYSPGEKNETENSRFFDEKRKQEILGVKVEHDLISTGIINYLETRGKVGNRVIYDLFLLNHTNIEQSRIWQRIQTVQLRNSQQLTQFHLSLYPCGLGSEFFLDTILTGSNQVLQERLDYFDWMYPGRADPGSAPPLSLNVVYSFRKHPVLQYSVITTFFRVVKLFGYEIVINSSSLGQSTKFSIKALHTNFTQFPGFERVLTRMFRFLHAIKMHGLCSLLFWIICDALKTDFSLRKTLRNYREEKSGVLILNVWKAHVDELKGIEVHNHVFSGFNEWLEENLRKVDRAPTPKLYEENEIIPESWDE